jgi:intracellular sulfur oxidation DsrE/DsrF family protein
MNIVKRHSRVHLSAILLVGLLAPVSAAEPGDSWDKVVFHLDEMGNARWALMLARSYLNDVPDARIVFVAYGPGVDFLVEDATDRHDDPYDYAVLTLAMRGVDFRVCAATLKARSVPASDLLDMVKIVPSGISEIARLQLKEGFAYLKP